MKNDYEIRGDVTAIFLNSRKFGRMETLIATSDLDRAKEFSGTWYVLHIKRNNSFYVTGRGAVDGKIITVYLHRWVLGVTETKQQVDHILHDTLDNCRWALNVVTQNENMQNTRKYRTNTSGHVGVYWYKKSKKWRADIAVNGKLLYLGLFEDIEEAIAARKEAEHTYHKYKSEIALAI